MLVRYAGGPPWLPRAREVLAQIAAQYPIALASSSNRPLIDAVLEAGGVTALFRAMRSHLVRAARGKPAPDVYLEAARRLAIDAAACVAVEDSQNGIRAAKAAGMACIAIPNAHFPPGAALAEADLVLRSVADLDPERIRSLEASTA